MVPMQLAIANTSYIHRELCFYVPEPTKLSQVRQKKMDKKYN